MLHVHGASLVFKNGDSLTYAVRDATLTVCRGELLGLVGPSGSGKSSLLYLMSGLKPATRGEVSFRDRSYGSLTPESLARLRRAHFGFVFQQHFLINYLSCLENVLVGALPADRDAPDRALALLTELGLGDRLHHRPYQLSIGQRQRVAIARAIIHDPEVLFTDEPTASLDHQAGHQVMELLGQYRACGAVVVVTHDLEMLADADRIITMRDGMLQSTGGEELQS